MQKRRQFTPEFKAKVVLETLTGVQSPAEACRKHAINPGLLSTWKTTFLQRAALVFLGDEHRSDDQARIAELEQLLGRLTHEHELLKKVSSAWNARATRNGR